MPTETLPDYSDVIRAQIETEVTKTKTHLENSPPYARAGSVSLGYIANSHHGMSLFRDGDRIAGLPVTIDRRDMNTLTVHSLAGDVKLRR